MHQKGFVPTAPSTPEDLYTKNLLHPQYFYTRNQNIYNRNLTPENFCATHLETCNPLHSRNFWREPYSVHNAMTLPTCSGMQATMLRLSWETFSKVELPKATKYCPWHEKWHSRNDIPTSQNTPWHKKQASKWQSKITQYIASTTQGDTFHRNAWNVQQGVRTIGHSLCDLSFSVLLLSLLFWFLLLLFLSFCWGFRNSLR